MSADRVFIFKQIPGAQTKDAAGAVDSRLFKGGNKLHAIMDPDALWHLKYEEGDLPQQLKQRYTSFNKLLESVKPYFEKRGLMIERTEQKFD